MLKTSRSAFTLALLTIALAGSLPVPADPIPPDLEARDAELRKQASPQLLAWAHEQGVALARARGPVDVGALELTIRSQFGSKSASKGKPGETSRISGPGAYTNLGSLGDGDIMAIAFIVMMEATKSAQEDLKAIMDGVKLINKQKDGLRKEQDTVNKLAAGVAASPTLTPGSDRVAQLVAAARSVHGKTSAANLSLAAHR